MKKNRLITIQNNEEQQQYKVLVVELDNRLRYFEKDNTKTIFDFNKYSLERESETLKMKYEFQLNKKTKGIIEMKELNKKIEVEINTKKINKEGNNIEIEYSIENQSFLYRIEDVI